MKKLFCYADRYIRKSDWKDLAMIKFCLFSMGILAGMRIPEKNRKQAGYPSPRSITLAVNTPFP